MAESPVVATDGGAVPAGSGARPAAGVEHAADGGAVGSSRSPGLRLGRRRQANVAGGRSRSFKVKVSEAEGAVLSDMARGAGVSVPRLLVEAGLAAGTGGQTSTGRREAMVELFAVHRLLAGISINVNQVAKATNATHQAPEEAGWSATLAAVRAVAFRIDEVIAVIGSEQRAAGRRR